MRRNRLKLMIFGLTMAIVCSFSLPSCGPLHSYWGVESDYYSDDYGYYGDNGHHKHHKPPKHKKHKYPKPPKQKKHHKHHHDDDDD